MPRVAHFTTAAIGDLFAQLRFAPPETQRRQMDAAERLVGDIDPAQNYPHAFVVFRITGYRPEIEEPTLIVGAALIPDLVNFVQRLSRNLALTERAFDRSALPLSQVAERLQVSPKSLQRYRRQGLVCHYAVLEDEVLRLVCFEDALQRFVARHYRRLQRAASFNRVGRQGQEQLVAEAQTIRESEGVSLNEAALRLARRHGRAHETVREILRRHDRRAAEPVFTERGPLTDREVRLIHRAWRLGVPVRSLAERLGKSAPTIQRSVNRRRGELLRRIPIGYVALPTFELEDAVQVILAAPPICDHLDTLLPRADALELLDAAHDAAPLAEDTEHALVAGLNLLKQRALAAINDLKWYPAAESLDDIETELRWASRIKRRLVSLALLAALRTVEQTLHRPLSLQPSEQIRSLIELAVRVVARAAEVVDPARGQRLARTGAYAMARELATTELPEYAGRATARHEPGSIPLAALLDELDPWQPLLELRRDLVPLVDRLDPARRQLILRHYGLDGRPPRTMADLADELEITTAAATRKLHQAERTLRGWATGQQ